MFTEPIGIKQIQRFLGLSGYFRKSTDFGTIRYYCGTPQYSLKARPLTNLLKDGVKFSYEEEQKKDF